MKLKILLYNNNIYSIYNNRFITKAKKMNIFVKLIYIKEYLLVRTYNTNN